MLYTGTLPKAFCRFCTVLSGLLLAWNVAAQTFTVNTNQDTNDVLLSDGICADQNKLCSLRAAIEESNALTGADEIILGPDTYKFSIAGKDDEAKKGDLDITGELKLSGAGSKSTVIDADEIDRVFDILENSVVTISGLTVLNGSVGRGRGAGISNKGQLLVENCIIKNNVANNGGGFSNDTGSSAIIKNTHIHDNSATYGGGIFVWLNSSVTLEGVTLSNNHATAQGGAIGGWSGGAVVNLINSTISGNRSDGIGGGIFIESVVVNMMNTTVSNNVAVDAAGLINGGIVNMANSIIASNIATGGLRPDCSSYRTINSQGYNLIGIAGSGCVVNTSVGDQIGDEINPVQALLLPLADNGGATPTHLLEEDSPAINAGNPATPGSSSNACMAVDQRGITRINDSVCDIGAVEQVPIADLWVTLLNSDDVVDGSGIVKQLVEVGNNGPNAASDISLIVKFPEGSVNHRTVGDAWECDFSAQQIDCSLPLLEFNTISKLELLFWPPIDFSALTTSASLQSSTFDSQLENNEFELEIIGDEKTKGEVDFQDGVISGPINSSVSGINKAEKSGQQLDNNESKQFKQKSDQFLTAGDSPEGDWVVLFKLVKHADDELEEDAPSQSSIRQKLLSNYEDSENSSIKRNLGAVGLGVIFFAGIVNIYAPTASMFGFLFSFPLWSHFDPVHLVLLSSKSRKRRRREYRAHRESENRDGEYGKILDDVGEEN